MNRYAPELALVSGGVLGVAFGGFVLVVLGEFYSAAVVCALCVYPFAAYAIHTDHTPTTVLPPRGVTVLAALGAVGVVFDSLRLFGPTVETLLSSTLVTVGIFLPVAAYASRYGEPPAWLRPKAVETGCILLAVGLLVGSVLTGITTSAASAVVVFVAGVLYGTRMGTRSHSQRRRRYWPVGGFVVAAGLLAVGIGTAGPLDRWMAGALAAVFGPLIAVALTTARNT